MQAFAPHRGYTRAGVVHTKTIISNRLIIGYLAKSTACSSLTSVLENNDPARDQEVNCLAQKAVQGALFTRYYHPY